MEADASDQLYNELPDTLKLVYSCLRKYGLFSRNKFKKHLPFSGTCFIALVLLFIALMQYPNMGNDVFEFIVGLEEVMAYIQMSGKIVTTMLMQNDLIQLFKQTKLFWNTNRCDEQTEKKLNGISYLIIYLQKAMGFLLVGGVGFAMVLAEIYQTPLLGTWTLKGYDKFHSYQKVLQIVAFVIFVPILWAVDCLFFTLCAESVIQFRILCHCLRNLTTSNVTEVDAQKESNFVAKLVDCIKYHQFLKKFTKKFLRCSSFILLAEFITIGPLVCAELYAASESTITHVKIRHAFIFCYYVTEIFCFCISANYVTYEATQVANAIYFSEWYTQDIRSLKALIIILIQNSQKDIVVTAGGFLTINAATALNVLKAAWSLCSLMKGLN